MIATGIREGSVMVTTMMKKDQQVKEFAIFLDQLTQTNVTSMWPTLP